MTTESTPPSISLNLRKIRRGKKLSLADVERLSKGRIKAVVLGSYERGSRSLSVSKAVLIASIYQVPLADLLDPPHRESGSRAMASDQRRMIVDMKKLTLLIATYENSENRVENEFHSIFRFVRRVIESRQDWNGEVISLRTSDITTLSVLTRMSEGQCLEMLYGHGLLLTGHPG